MITFRHLQAGYQGRAVTPVLSTKLAQGSMTALTGANGSGKSTLIKTIAGLLPPVSGCCDLQVSRREVGWLPQRSELETRFPLTVFELVSIGCWPRCGWFGGINGTIYARNVMDALIKADPQDAEDIRRRGENYIQQLQKLDSWAKTAFAAIPQQKRKVLTSHDAFGYFGQRYGITFLAPVGFSTEAEASASDMGSLIAQLKQENITTYFIENQTDPRLVKQIASATGAQPGGELYPEALSTASGPAPTYEAAFKHNVNVMLRSMN